MGDALTPPSRGIGRAVAPRFAEAAWASDLQTPVHFDTLLCDRRQDPHACCCLLAVRVNRKMKSAPCLPGSDISRYQSAPSHRLASDAKTDQPHPDGGQRVVKGPRTRGAADDDKAGTAEDGDKNRRDFDTLIKELTWKSDALPTALGAASVVAHLATEFSETSRRTDYCVRLTDGSILHVEFQSADETDLVWRMINYRRLIRIKLDRTCILRQVVLFIGDEPAPSGSMMLNDGELTYQCRARDIKEFAPDHFLASPKFDDNVLALLCSDGTSPRVLYILRIKFDLLPEDQRVDARRKLLLAAVLRNISLEVFEDFTMAKTQLEKDPLFGKLFEEERAKGRAEGKAEGEIETRATSLISLFKARGWSVPVQALDAARKADAATFDKLISTAANASSVNDFVARFGLIDHSGIDL